MHARHVAPWERALVAGLSRFAGPTSQHWFPETRRRAQQISEDNEPKLSASGETACSPLNDKGATVFGDSLTRVWAVRGLIPARLDLLEELQRHLRCLVCLSKHGHCRLLQDLVADHLRNRLSNVSVTDTTVRSPGVFRRNSKAVDGALQSVLVGADFAPGRAYVLDRSVQCANRTVCPRLSGDRRSGAKRVDRQRGGIRCRDGYCDFVVVNARLLVCPDVQGNCGR